VLDTFRTLNMFEEVTITLASLKVGGPPLW
jgi:hypothetical protein